MPRKEINAPTERIMNILDDIATLEDYCREIESIIGEKYPDDLSSFPRRPSLEYVIAERARQSLTLEQTRRRREYARRFRSLAKDHNVDALSMKDLKENL